MAKPYSLWWAEVKFKETDGSKIRPVLALEDGTAAVLCMRVTGSPPKAKGDFEITEWAYAGLLKPSTVNTAWRLKMDESELLDRIGELHPNDVSLLRVRHFTP